MKRLPLLLLAGAMLFSLTACLEPDKKHDIPFEVAPKVEPHTAPEGTFDVDAVRSMINIKGQHFDLPQLIDDLGKNWEFRYYDRKDYGLKEGSGLATLYYSGVEMGTVSLENCYTGREQDSVMYSIAIKTSDSDIYGITPMVSTIADVEHLIGQPDTVDLVEKPYVHIYHYGINLGEDAHGIVRGHNIAVSFDEQGIVDLVSITYSDLTQQEQG
ncbi:MULTISPECIES: hypothetical protein [Ruminococcus]|uniref:Lipoprotein n=1 Tax=Ruminococcus flavefaciens TaxID=1265 RepID=A0A1M7GE20_RUMFL|nr:MULTISPECIES: hypothetical protein [Ruminococcus]MCR4795657.1 hypothetical protein [Ruminococcus sp.]SHM14644.1 hypothetical protein SAMN04487860_101252 [Ruminococcus flavefaciens]